MKTIKDLPGLGEKSEQVLLSVGIDSIQALRQLGAVHAFIKVKKSNSTKPSMNLLYALVGALEGHHWLSVAKTQKAELLMLLEEYEEFEQLFKTNDEPFTLEQLINSAKHK
ncbi:hypothetical protein PSECIP111854_00783 [Pseudoalteromonas sp. CIP111854]|uniref:TfoX C-terminal domain-containing protein n=1 Tax=Pseudoalteromonas holothuriae TaxID=2963714 RepID=A0A9W4QSS9_9GAMM|nr:TfoX/Sxy family protein [Pseudoalteromonas sp. CIP111854]CAH9051618.1 hypothetical protein PSECIP111854_00783 [Pseudoalteromonas sp. CIP111854]